MHTTQEHTTEFLRQTMFSMVVAVRINLWVSYCVFISDCRSQYEKHNDFKFWRYFGTFNKQIEFTYTSGIIVLKEDINPIKLPWLPSLPLTTIAGESLSSVCMSSLGTLTMRAISHLVFHWLMPSAQYLTPLGLPMSSQHDASPLFDTAWLQHGQVPLTGVHFPGHCGYFPQGVKSNNWGNTTRSWASCWMNWRVLRSSEAPQTLSSTSFLQWAQMALCSASALAGRR